MISPRSSEQLAGRTAPPDPGGLRLIATDLDGTLLRSDGTLGAATRAVLRRLIADGVLVTLVTGRPLRWLAEVYDQLGRQVPAVCANGAVVCDPTDTHPLRAMPLSPATLAEACVRLRAEVPGIAFAVEIDDGRQLLYEAAFPLRWENGDEAVREVATLAELVARPAVKLLARAEVSDPDRFTELVAGCLGGSVEATHSSSSGLVEISAAGVTKATGLAWLCARRGLPAEKVIAFGDMPNDVPMLAWAGWGVAVANAHPAVLAAADDVAGGNDEEGVARYLELCLPG